MLPMHVDGLISILNFSITNIHAHQTEVLFNQQSNNVNLIKIEHFN